MCDPGLIHRIITVIGGVDPAVAARKPGVALPYKSPIEQPNDLDSEIERLINSPNTKGINVRG